MPGRIICMFACGALLVSGPVAAEEKSPKDESKKEEVLGLLMGYEYCPTKEDWEQIGPEAGFFLMEIASETGRPKIIRARAVLALRFFPGKETLEFITGLIGDDEQDEMIVRKGLYSLSRGFGKEALNEILGFLDHENPDIREAAVRAAAGVVCKKSLAALKRRLKVEKNEMVRKVLRDKIKDLQARLKKENG